MRTHLSLFLLLLCITFNAIAQAPAATTKRKLLSKKWVLIQYQEADKAPIIAPDVLKNDYTKFNIDGSYESFEEGLLIKGSWTLNESTMLLTMTQTQIKEYPAKMVVKVILLNETNLTFESAATATTPKMTLFMKVK